MQCKRFIAQTSLGHLSHHWTDREMLGRRLYINRLLELSELACSSTDPGFDLPAVVLGHRGCPRFSGSAAASAVVSPPLPSAALRIAQWAGAVGACVLCTLCVAHLTVQVGSLNVLYWAQWADLLGVRVTYMLSLRPASTVAMLNASDRLSLYGPQANYSSHSFHMWRCDPSMTSAWYIKLSTYPRSD